MKLGLVGLPNVGKSTLFNAITRAGAASANYPFCTIEPNIGSVSVPDDRLLFLKEMYDPEKFTPATLDFVDIAGLVRGASKGEGLGNRFLSHIRETDALVHVVRCFEGTDVVHVDGAPSPARDIETINLELVFSDIEILSRRIDKTKKLLKGDRSLETELSSLEQLLAHLEAGKPARSFENEMISAGSDLLSAKPVIYAANLSEDDFMSGTENNENYRTLCKIAEQENAVVLPVCAKLEEEIAPLPDEEKAMFLTELGLEKSGLDRIIQKGYSLLNLISFFTAGEKEVRSWTIEKGTKAPGAAGKIHSDFERGFIRAEIVAFDVLKELGNMAACREKGQIRSEGKEYVMNDGDVTLFRFNV